jgi:hypothetical protein
MVIEEAYELPVALQAGDVPGEEDPIDRADPQRHMI